MEKRVWTGLGDAVSLLGYGCMRLPLRNPKDPASIDYPAAKALVRRAWEQGVNYFDTAWPYHGGQSETFLGEALQVFPRESYYLATKMPTWELVSSREDAEEIFTQQLRRCQTEYFDFYLMHNLNHDHFKNVQQINLFAFLEEKKREGRIRHIGFSFHDTPALLETIVDAYPWDFAQIQLNYLDWEILEAQKQYEILRNRGLPIAVMEPVRGGMLARLDETSAKILHQADPDHTQASWALRFAASLPGVMVVLSGMSDQAQVDDNLETFNNFHCLEPEEYRVLAQVVENFRKIGAVPCTGCRYCIDCPQGVNIARIFAIYNQFCLRKESAFFCNDYRTLSQEERAGNCIQCGRCETYCPQRIPIMETLQKINAEISPMLGGI